MLTGPQVDFLGHISVAAWFGIVTGALCGSLVGALVRALRTQSLWGLMAGVVFGFVPGAASGAVAAIAIGVIETLVFEIGAKGVCAVPDWFIGPMCFVVFAAAGLAATLAVPNSRTAPRSRGRLLLSLAVWTALGGLLGAIANLGPGFAAYLNNERPIRWATRGLVFGGCVALFWRAVIELLIRKDCARSMPAKQAQECHEKRVGWIGTLRASLIVAVTVVATAWLTTYILLRASSSTGPGFTARFNCLLPIRPTVVVENDDCATPKCRGVFHFQGTALKSVLWYDSSNHVFSAEFLDVGPDSSFDPMVECGEGARSPAERPSIGGWSDGEVSEWSCNGQFAFRHRRSGMEAVLQFVVPFLAGFAAFAVDGVLTRKREHKEAKRQNSQVGETVDGGAAS